MPRPNPGPQLRFNKQRQKYYIVWHVFGNRELRSTGTADLQKAQQVYDRFMSERTDLCIRERPVRIEYDDIGPRRAKPDRYVYFIGSDAGPIKIGVATSVKARLAALQSHSPVPLRLLAAVPGDHTREYYYHSIFHEHRLHGEWFKPADAILSEIEAINAG